MAERSGLTVVQKPTKTQESMRSKLEEWRKTKQQQTAKQLKQQIFPRTPGVNPKLSQPNATSTKSNSKGASISKPSLSHRKRKTFHALQYDKITDENTAEKKSCKIVHNGLNDKEITSKLSIQKKNLSEDPLFRSKPPERFEIEITLDPKKARRSTFTIETPMKGVAEKRKENLEVCKNNQRNLRKSQARPTIQKSLKPPQVNQQNFCKVKDGLDSRKKRNKSLNSGNCRQACSTAKKREENQKRKAPSIQVENVSQVTKNKVESKDDRVNLTRTPVKQLPHMDKSLSMRARLEFWRKEKGKAQGVLKTPATLQRKSTMKARKKHHQPITNMDTEEPLQLEPFDTMTCDMAEKEPTPEEIRKRLQDCLEKLQEDKTNDEMIANNLDEIHKCHPGALQCAEYWICRAKIAEHEEDDGRVVCLYEQALVFNAEPEYLIKEAVAGYSKKRKGQEETKEEEVLSAEVPANMSTEGPTALFPLTPHREVAALKQTGQPSPLYSSVIKYSVTKATPFKSRLNSCERPVVTPVRRSARLERRSMYYPVMLQEHSLAVRHLDDLPEDIKKDVLFKPNFTVQNDLNEAWKDLWNE